MTVHADKDDDGFEGTPDDILLPTPEINDNYVGVCVDLPLSDGMAQGKVTKRARDNDGNPIGRANENPIKDSREYTVEFEDGRDADLAANVIAQSMYAQCVPEGIYMSCLTLLLTFVKALLPTATQTNA